MNFRYFIQQFLLNFAARRANSLRTMKQRTINHSAIASKSIMTEETKVRAMDKVVVRFSGDSGDGMQLTGTLFSDTSALLGNGISTFPDYLSRFTVSYISA